MADGGRRRRRAAMVALVSFFIAAGWTTLLRGGTSGRVQRSMPGSSGPEAPLRDRSFQSTPLTEAIQLSYGWPGFEGRSLRISVTIPRPELASSERAFGFSVAELREFLIEAEARIRRERGLTAAEIARRVVASERASGWCDVGEDPENRFNFVLRSESAGRPGRAAEIDGIIRASRRAWETSQKKIAARLEEEMWRFLKARGMVITPHGIAVDYRELVRENRARLASLAAEFKKSCGPNKKKLLEAVLSFVQSIPSRPRPPVEEDKYTAGMAVPLRVLADDSGDCDSKAVLFAALWTSLCRHRTILITVREHMLVGVADPFASGSTLELDSIRYVLLEVNCGGSLLPGEVTAHSLDSIARGQLKYRIVS